MSSSRRAFTLAAGAVALGVTPVRAQPPAAPVLVVLNSRSDSISRVDPERMVELDRLPVGREPHHVILCPGAREVMVGCSAGNEAVFLDPRTGAETRRIVPFANPYHLGFSPDGRTLLITSLRLSRVDLYSWDGERPTLDARVPGMRMASHVEFTPDGVVAVVTNQAANEIAVFDVARRSLAWRLDVGAEPAGVRCSLDGRYAIVGIMGSDHVAVVDLAARQVVRRIATGKGAHAVEHIAGGVFAVSNRLSDTVTLLDTAGEPASWRVEGQIPVRGGPDCAVFDKDRRRMWVTSRWAHTVARVDLLTLKVDASVSVGRSPHGIWLDAS